MRGNGNLRGRKWRFSGISADGREHIPLASLTHWRPGGELHIPYRILPSGAPMHDAYWAGLGVVDPLDTATPSALAGGSQARENSPGRTYGPWLLRGCRGLDPIVRTGPHFCSADASLAALTTTGRIGATSEFSRTSPIAIDTSIWLAVTSYLAFISTLDRRALTKCFRGVLYLRSVGFKLVGISTCIWALKFPAAYGLAAPSVNTSDWTAPDSTGSGSNKSGKMLSVGAGSPESPKHGADNQASERELTTKATDSAAAVADCTTTTPAAEVNVMYWNLNRDFSLKLTSDKSVSILKLCDIMVFCGNGYAPRRRGSRRGSPWIFPRIAST
ncbi:hypothetical protein B0H19DRAFT_1386052 [Mycena capillaripes]|nr:hypothetical protein B0H19DRAFT_1386052 [Mycena capillaripes]